MLCWQQAKKLLRKQMQQRAPPEKIWHVDLRLIGSLPGNLEL
ncbi:hypothetical protein SAMN05660691_03588 [Rheinheimera pacifica]|uniref:Uncharacterized protein n=1 Tax=Rheinheimera pacifica TaxID=173990 RepID=A0A1H6NF98_9GAMM|nr:hypothetical protein SAMN05660691_03588 [Rheinheimera pacifica]